MPDGVIDPCISYVATLDHAANLRWPTILKAQKDTQNVQRHLREMLREFTSDDADIVVFGSLARNEWTSGSDVDWSLLIDGQANTEHRHTARSIERRIKEYGYKGPGSEGTFGNLCFSHDIIHRIGGQSDSNRNTTQRILLLLESAALREHKNQFSGPCERTVRQILSRYLVSDSNFHCKSDEESRVPRFLLNDIVRYWRTMCVDFAYKDWEQGGEKWALRNIKLRMSRKLMFISGLFMVFSCFQNQTLGRPADAKSDYFLMLQEHLLKFVHSTPLNIVVWTLEQLNMRAECGSLLDSYEAFLNQIDDANLRRHLETLREDTVYQDSRFLECRNTSIELQTTLDRICFQNDSEMRDFICKYGVF